MSHHVKEMKITSLRRAEFMDSLKKQSDRMMQASRFCQKCPCSTSGWYLKAVQRKPGGRSFYSTIQDHTSQSVKLPCAAKEGL